MGQSTSTTARTVLTAAFTAHFFGSSFIGGDFVGNFIGNGSGLTDVWQTTGNSGTTAGANFLGTTDNQPLELHVNGIRAFRLEPTANTGFATSAVNVIGGSPANFAGSGILGVTIAGGGAPYYFGTGTENRVLDNFGTIGGGVNNDIETNAYESTIGGGNANSILPGSFRSTIAGGWANAIETNASASVIGGGQNNNVGGPVAVIAGGYDNTNSALASFVGGGEFNNIQSNAYFSVIAGGDDNAVQNGTGTSVIGGGFGNTVQSGLTTCVIGGGQNNTIGAPWAVIAGGYFNTNAGWVSFIGAGDYNDIQAGSLYSVIGGGYKNIANGIGVFVGGGGYDGSTFAGNQSYANASVIGGGLGNSIQISAPYSALGGGEYNSIEAFSTNATIAGGYANVIQLNANSAFIGGGQFNNIEGYSANATIAGGTGNVIQTNNYASTIGGGLGNEIQSSTAVGAVAGSTIAGGFDNLIQTNGFNGTIAGGLFNLIENQEAVIGGGGYNTNNAYFGTIPGGYENVAAGNYSFAVGNRAQALYSGDFVWADSQNTNFAATASDQVSFRCQGGVRFTSGSGAANQTVAWTPGSGGWSFPSDRNLKDRFQPVDDESVLARVAQLPIVEWSYKGYAQRHIGAMAQDFHAQFPLNNDDKSLNDADLHGVELAAIQGLDRKLEQKETEITELQQQNAALEKRLENLEQMVKSINDKN